MRKIIFLIPLILSGCVSQTQFDDLHAKTVALRNQINRLSADKDFFLRSLDQLNSNDSELIRQIGSIRKRMLEYDNQGVVNESSLAQLFKDFGPLNKEVEMIKEKIKELEKNKSNRRKGKK